MQDVSDARSAGRRRVPPVGRGRWRGWMVWGLACWLGAGRAAVVPVEVFPRVEHRIGGVSELDRSRSFTIHSSHTDPEWRRTYRGEPNFTNDLLRAFIEGYDVYFGRETGGITWHLWQRIDEDPARPGWPLLAGGAYSIASQGAAARRAYGALTEVHGYEPRARGDILAAQFRPFWPDGTPTARGWALSQADTPSEPFGSATGYYMAHYLRHFYGAGGSTGRPAPGWVEVINEPDYPLFDDPSDPAYGTATPAKLWRFHVSVADQIHRLYPDMKVGGFCAAFPDLEKNDFQEWREQWATFIDQAGPFMDFISLHFYDFEDWTRLLRRGSNLEATLDLIEQYAVLRLGKPLPLVISEFGGRARHLENGPWSPARDWVMLKALNGMLPSFLDRPHLIGKVIPFIPVKAEWGRDDHPYAWRLMRQAGEPDSASGPWVYTELVRFYQLWAGVRGTRVWTRSGDPDVPCHAWLDGNRLAIVLNNLESAAQTVNLELRDAAATPVERVVEKNLFWDGSAVVLEETPRSTLPASLTLRPEGAVVLEVTFARPPALDQWADETKQYAASLLRPIRAGEPLEFVAPAPPPARHGAAVLRLGLGRNRALSRQPLLLFNNMALPVPVDVAGPESDSRPDFFGVVEVPVPHGLIEPTNRIVLRFPDDGGFVASVTLRVVAFSDDVQGDGGPVREITLQPSEGTLAPGESLQLMAAVAPFNTPEPRLRWDSGSPLVARVDATGRVEALRPGVAWIMASSGDGGVRGRCRVTVLRPAVPAGTPVIASMERAGGRLRLAVTNGPPRGAFDLLEAPSPDTPAAAWTPCCAEQSFDAEGAATVELAPGPETRFFRVRVTRTGPPPIAAMFDWAEVEVGTSWWLGYGYTETENGVTLVCSGRAASHGGSDGVGGVGFALKAAYPQDAEPGRFRVQLDGVFRPFVVRSIDLAAHDGGGRFVPMVRGLFEGVEQWRIVPPPDRRWRTYRQATSGDMSRRIDEILWDTGVAANPDTVFDNMIDNLSVEVFP